MLCYLTRMEPYYIQCIKDGPFQPNTAEGANKPKSQCINDERRVVNQDQRLKSIIISCLPDDIMESVIRFVYEDNLILRRYPESKKALITAPSITPISTAFFSNNVVQDFQENSDDESPKPFQSKNKGLVAETFDWDEEEVYDDEEMTQVKVLMALANDELAVGKNHARNGEWIDITMRKVNIPLSMDEDADWQNYLNQAVNECLKLTEAPTDPESSKESGSKPLTTLPPLKVFQGAVGIRRDDDDNRIGGLKSAVTTVTEPALKLLGSFERADSLEQWLQYSEKQAKIAFAMPK
ncbi:hypothetical protein Tco_0994733, partial [Tanacetum coccineum]